MQNKTKKWGKLSEKKKNRNILTNANVYSAQIHQIKFDFSLKSDERKTKIRRDQVIDAAVKSMRNFDHISKN